MFSSEESPLEHGSFQTRVRGVAGIVGVRQGCPVPVDIEDPDIGRLEERRERVLFSVPSSRLLEKYNVDE